MGEMNENFGKGKVWFASGGDLGWEWNLREKRKRAR